MQVLICDNDTIYANRCKERISMLATKNNIEIRIETVGTGENLLFFKDTKFAKADLIYIDWHLPKCSGFQVAQKLRERGMNADIVFYTVDENHAIDGYDVEALHYIVKDKTPTEKFDEIFFKAVKRVKKRAVEVLAVSCAGEHRSIPVEDILYFSVQNRIVTIHYYKGKEIVEFEFYSPLSKIEENLFKKGFLRIHNSYLVNEKYIHKKNTRKVVLSDSTELLVGTSYRNKVVG